MLVVENLTKYYKSGFIERTKKALNSVSFSVNSGEIFGFIGPNGAGKTTTFKSILNFVSTSAGSKITINGKSNTDNTIKNFIGYLPENPYFCDYLTGEELLRYMGRLHSVEDKILNERIVELLKKVNMTHAKNMQLRKYSKGMLQRIAIAQALINDPDFLILDEPMSGLDPIGRREIRDLIIEQKQKGKTILLSSHILVDVESLCDRVGVILNGVVVKVGVLTDLYNEIDSDYELILNCKKSKVESIFGISNISIQERAGFTVLGFYEDRKREVLNSILDSGVEVISLYPLGKSLEGIFEEEANKLLS